MLDISLVSIICTLINVLLLLFLLKKFLFKPVNDILEKRQAMIDDNLKQAEQSKKEAEELKNEYEGALISAKEESLRIVAEAKEQAKTEHDHIVADAAQSSEEMIAHAKQLIALEKEKSLHELENQITDLILDAATKVVEKKMDDDENLKLIDKFLSEVGEQS